MMQRFYFHIRQDRTLFEDRQGADVISVEAAWAWARQDAQELIVQDTVLGPIELKSVEIADSHGLFVGSLPFVSVQLH